MTRLASFRIAFALWLVAATLARAATLSHPAVDAYNVRVGTQTFAGRYHFTTNSLLVETAQAIRDLGSDVLKCSFGPECRRQYGFTPPKTVTNLLTLARDEPSYRRVFDMPFRHYLLWAYPYAKWWPFDGYAEGERTGEYREIYDLTRYFLTNYARSGKTFYLGHWEGDWYLLPSYNANTNPTPTALQGMVDWLRNRQQAVDDAKRDTPPDGVNVFCYAEVNRVRDAMVGDSQVNQRAINRVVPYVTNLDCLSWSSYDGMNLSAAELTATLNYMESQLPTNKAAIFPGRRIWIGEYGWGAKSTAEQEPLTRAYIQRLLSWGPRFILFWEIYNNEPDRNFCLIDPAGEKTDAYYLHQRLINQARLFAARFQEKHGRLPADSESAARLAPLLDHPLRPPVPLAVTNLPVTGLTATSATLRGEVTQGIYGDDQAAVWVFWGRKDGAATREDWEQRRLLGVNTRFNPTAFTTTLTDLLPNQEYSFRFYATNATAETWASASTSFRTP